MSSKFVKSKVEKAIGFIIIIEIIENTPLID